MVDRIKINPFSSDQISTLLMGEAGKEKIIGAKDTEYTDFRGTTPITDAEVRIDRIRKNAGTAKDAILGGFWDAVKGGAETVYDIYQYGPRGVPQEVKIQRAKEAKAALDKVKEDEQLQIQYEQALANRRPIENVRAEIAQIIAAAQKTENTNPGKINQNDLEARILAYVRSQGYTANEIQGGDDVDVDLLPDPYGLTTSSPNPFPEAENIMKFGGGVGGNILGYKMSKNWAIAQPSVMGKAATAFGKGVQGGFKFWKGGPYWGRMAGALAGGLVGVLTADYGYETALDVANQAGVFGKKGINRPGVAERARSLLNTAETEIKLTGATAFVAPSINSVRNMFRAGLGAGDQTIPQTGMRLAEKFIPEGQYGGTKGFIKKTGEPESIVGITDVSAFRSVQGIPNVILRFPLIGGGGSQNLVQRAQKLNVILDNMTNRIAPSVGYNRLSEAVTASSNLTAKKLTNELTKLRKEWFDHATARGAVVKMAGKIGDDSPHSIITDFKAHMAQTAGRGIDGTPLPTVTKNKLNQFFDNILQEPGSITLARADAMLDELGKIMKMGGMKNNPTAINFAEQFSQAVQNAARKIDLGEAGKSALKRYDDLWTHGQMLMNGPVAKQLWGANAKNMLYGFQYKLANQGTKYADDLLHTAKLMESPQAMQHLYEFVGPNIFRGMMRRHITSAYDSALTTWPGKSFLDLNSPLAAKITNQEGVAAAKRIDPKKFIENLGLDDKGGRLYGTIEEGLKISQKKGVLSPWMRHLPDELVDAGADKKTIEALGGLNTTKFKEVTTGFVTPKDLTDFATILESAFRGGVPDISTFIARRAQISGMRGAIKSFLPAAGGGAATGAAIPQITMVHAVMFSLLARQAGKILTNPINLKAANNILKATDEDLARVWNPLTYTKFGSAPKALALKNALQTIGANFNGELEDLDKTFADALNQQGRREQLQKVMPETSGEETMKKINIFEKMKQAAQAKQGIREESLAPAVTGDADMVSAAPISSPTSVGATTNYSGGTTGSSIAANTTMNPNAAASLYTGNTDAALANQFGTPTGPTTQMPTAARGGIISLVS
jgi:hypothetical protein